MNLTITSKWSTIKSTCTSLLTCGSVTWPLWSGGTISGLRKVSQTFYALQVSLRVFAKRTPRRLAQSTRFGLDLSRRLLKLIWSHQPTLSVKRLSIPVTLQLLSMKFLTARVPAGSKPWITSWAGLLYRRHSRSTWRSTPTPMLSSIRWWNASKRHSKKSNPTPS